jgi:hypothetical protein
MLMSPISGPHAWLTIEGCTACGGDESEVRIVSHDPVDADATLECTFCGCRWYVRDQFVGTDGVAVFLNGEPAPVPHGV